jgi:hypothetical protein
MVQHDPEDSLEDYYAHTREIVCNSVTRTVRRESWVRAEYVRPGINPPPPPLPGLHSISASGEKRFLRMDYPELPDIVRFKEPPNDTLCVFLSRESRMEREEDLRFLVWGCGRSL